MNRLCAPACLSVVMILIWAAVAPATVVLNGDFSATPGVGPDPFQDWTTYTATYGLPTVGSGRPGQGNAVLFDELQGLSEEIEQTFFLPQPTASLSFEFRIERTGTLTGSPPDSFQATLWDSSVTTPLLPPGSFSAFYSIDATGLEFPGPGVSVADLGGGWRRVTADVSGVSPQSVLVEFILNSAPDGLETSVLLDNVQTAQANVIPEPNSMTILVGLVALVLPAGVVRRRFIRK